MRYLIAIIALCAIFACSGCVTEYYEPKTKELSTEVDGEIRGPIKRKGMLPFSDGKSFHISFM